MCVHACGGAGRGVCECAHICVHAFSGPNFMSESSSPLFMQAGSPNQTEGLLLELFSLGSLL